MSFEQSFAAALGEGHQSRVSGDDIGVGAQQATFECRQMHQNGHGEAGAGRQED